MSERSGRWTALRLTAAARGVSRRTAAGLVGSLGVVWVTSFVSVELRPADSAFVAGATVDSAVLVGLVAPAGVLCGVLQDRLAPYMVTSARSVYSIRAAWLAALTGIMLLVSIVCGLVAHGQAGWGLVAADSALFMELSVVGAVLLGAPHGWLLPAAVALLSSTPRLLPYDWNVLIHAEDAAEVWVVAAVTALVGTALFVCFDDYGLRPMSRMTQRLPALLDD